MPPPKAPTPQVRFKMIADGCPEFLPLTTRDREILGEALRIHPSKYGRLIRRPCLCLPQNDLCAQYMRWFEANPGRPAGVGTMMLTNRDWITTFGERAYTELITELQGKGRPTVHWQYFAGLDPDVEEEDPGDGRMFD